MPDSPTPSIADQGTRRARPISERRLRRLHARARRQRASNLPAQRLLRVLLSSWLRISWRPVISGREHLPASGQLLVAANHRSALDPLALIYALDRPARFMAASDMFVSWPKALLFSSLGAFPVRRGESDREAIETATVLLQAGEAVVVFPEGRLVRPTGKPYLLSSPPSTSELGIGDPKRGVGRLALATQSPIVPVAMVGTEAPTAAWWRRGAEIRVAFAQPIMPEPLASEQTPEVEQAGELVNEGLWPRVKDGVSALEIDRRKALAAGAGVGLTAAALIAIKLFTRTRRR